MEKNTKCETELKSNTKLFFNDSNNEDIDKNIEKSISEEHQVPVCEQNAFTVDSQKSNTDMENNPEAIGTIKSKRLSQTILSTKKIAIIAVLGAMSFVLYMFVKFPISFMFPSFLEMQFSEMPALIGGFALGPISGSIIIVIRYLLKLPFTMTAGVGEFTDLLLGLSIVLPSSLIYKKFKNKKGAIMGLIAGMILCIVTAVLANRYIVVPYYVNVMFGNNWAPIIGMMKGLFPNINESNFYSYYIPLSVIPFNILRCLLSGIITFIIYKKISLLIKKIASERKK